MLQAFEEVRKLGGRDASGATDGDRAELTKIEQAVNMSATEGQQLRCLLNRICQLFMVGLAHRLMVRELVFWERTPTWIVEPWLNRHCTDGDSRDVIAPFA